jgi:hypothetical protein
VSDDFRKLIEDIESEAKAEGPAAEAELHELRQEFSIADHLKESLDSALPPGRRIQAKVNRCVRKRREATSAGWSAY